MKKLTLILFALALYLVGPAQIAAQQRVTITGQLVCSVCWTEADRKTTPFGSQADIDCAIECAEKGLASAIAVKDGDDYKLYFVEQKQLKEQRAEWLTKFGQQVEIGGRLFTKNDQQYITPEKIRYLSTSSRQQPSVIGSEVELALKDLAGIDQRLSSFRSRIVVLNFWATWCGPCRKEMPDLTAVQNAYAPFGVQVIGASADQLADRAKVVQFIAEARVNFPVWLGLTTADMQRFGVGPGLPATVIIGRDGKVIWVKPTVIQAAELKKEIDRLLGRDIAAAERGSSSIVREGASQTSAEPRGRTDVSLVPS